MLSLLYVYVFVDMKNSHSMIKHWRFTCSE